MSSDLKSESELCMGWNFLPTLDDKMPEVKEAGSEVCSKGREREWGSGGRSALGCSREAPAPTSLSATGDDQGTVRSSQMA